MLQQNKNGATIAEHITKTQNLLNTWCEEKDFMIIDHGFRDVVEVFSDLGYEPKMSVYLRKGQKQRTTEEFNESRLVTKIRRTYRVKVKKWKLFLKRIENQMIPKLRDWMRITSAALNKYCGSILKNVNNAENQNLACFMQYRLTENNKLLEKIQLSKLSVKQRWKNIDDIDIDFPEVNMNILRQLFFGTYQIKQSVTYTEEHLDAHDDFVIQVSLETDIIIRCAIKGLLSNTMYGLNIHSLEHQFDRGTVNTKPE